MRGGSHRTQRKEEKRKEGYRRPEVAFEALSLLATLILWRGMKGGTSWLPSSSIHHFFVRNLSDFDIAARPKLCSAETHMMYLQISRGEKTTPRVRCEVSDGEFLGSAAFVSPPVEELRRRLLRELNDIALKWNSPGRKFTSGPLFFFGARHEMVAVSLEMASRWRDCGTVQGSGRVIGEDKACLCTPDSESRDCSRISWLSPRRTRTK